MRTTWSPLLDRIENPRDSAALRDVQALLERLIKAYGNNAVARMLDVDMALVLQWNRGHQMSQTVVARVIDLHYILTRAFQIFSARNAARRLVGQEPLLAGARPIDVLVLRGAAPVIEALNGIEQGAFR